MNLTDNGLKRIEIHADKQHNVTVMLLCQVILEVRELKALLNQGNNACNSSDCSSSGTDYGKN